MARSTEVIFNGMVARKEQLASLVGYTPNGLANSYQYVLQQMNSKSKVALWLQILFVISEGVHTSEKLWDYFSAEVDEKLNSKEPLIVRWYRKTAFEFQMGDPVIWNGKEYVYLIIDESKRIVAQCSVNDNGGVIRIKVARSDGNGGLQKFTPTQTAALAAYFVKKRGAGADTRVSSFDPDRIKLWYNIKFDPLVYETKVEAAQAAKDALKSFFLIAADEDFDGNIVLTKITDALQKVPGIIDPVVKAFLGTYGSVGDFDRLAFGDYETNAGYAVLDEAYFDFYTTFEAVSK